MITVKQNNANGKLFENLNVGETFEHKGIYLIKIGDVTARYGTTVNAINVTDGSLHRLSSTDMVIPFDAELIIKRKEEMTNGY